MYKPSVQIQMTLRLALVTLFVLCCVPPFGARAQTAAEPVRITYGFDREFPPFSYEDPGGIPVGFEIELVRAIFHGTNANLAFRPLQWERISLELSSGAIHLTTGMVRTEQRAKFFLFSKTPTFPLQIKLFTKIYNRFPSAAMLQGQAVSVEKGSYQHRLLEAAGNFNIKTYQNRMDALRALFRDEVSALCAPVQNTYYYINKLEYGAITTVGTPLGITEMRVAVNRGRGDIQRMVDEGMQRVRASGEYNRLYRKWFVRELTGQERSLMLRAAALAAVPSYAPYSKKDYGAAVLTATGKVYSACAVENADPAANISALQGAVARAVSDGEFELRAAVITDAKGVLQNPTPEELQILHEFGYGVLLVQEPEKGRYAESMAAELLPNPTVRDTGLTIIN